MRQSTPKLVLFATLALFIGSLGACSLFGSDDDEKMAGTDFLTYTKMTTRPYHTDMDAVGHADTWHNIWVNDVGLSAYMSRSANVPVGTVVVKEDFTNTDGAPGAYQKYLVMEKRSAGYDPDYGDWHYSVRTPEDEIMVIDGTTMDGALAYCKGCHIGASSTGYLFGPPDSVRVTQ